MTGFEMKAIFSGNGSGSIVVKGGIQSDDIDGDSQMAMPPGSTANVAKTASDSR